MTDLEICTDNNSVDEKSNDFELTQWTFSALAFYAHEKNDLDLAGYLEVLTIELKLLEPGETFLHPKEKQRLDRRIENAKRNTQLAQERADRLAARKERKSTKGGN